jgi:hypothetical protein
MKITIENYTNNLTDAEAYHIASDMYLTNKVENGKIKVYRNKDFNYDVCCSLRNTDDYYFEFKNTMEVQK